MKLLIADDEAAIRQSIKLTLTGEPYELREVGDLDALEKELASSPPDLLLLDLHFQNGRTSLDLMRTLAAEGSAPAIIVLSGAASASEAAQAIKLGAYDFLEKPVSADRLRLTLERCVETTALRQKFQGVTLQSGVAPQLVGASPATESVRREIEQFAPKDVRILITGETGTGKEVVAQNIWRLSPRANRPLIVVNSAAIPDNLLESELYGHKKGAFTGAHTDQIGKIEMADRGTLFLDEVGDLSASAQTKLLRFLESGEIQKVGSQQIKKADVRLIAATSRDLEKELERGTFRADLFYRLNVVRIRLSPLRERKEDLFPLFCSFVNQFSQKFKEPKKVIDADVAEALAAHTWPGNVRELRNIAERLALTPGPRVLKETLQGMLGLRLTPSEASTTEEPLSLKEFKRRSEKDYIELILARADGSVTKAAQILKIDRTYLHQKMVDHKINKS